jgi:hypothetical protein
LKRLPRLAALATVAVAVLGGAAVAQSRSVATIQARQASLKAGVIYNQLRPPRIYGVRLNVRM